MHEGPDDDPDRLLRILTGFSVIDAGLGKQVETQLTVLARSFAHLNEGFVPVGLKP